MGQHYYDYGANDWVCGTCRCCTDHCRCPVASAVHDDRLYVAYERMYHGGRHTDALRLLGRWCAYLMRRYGRPERVPAVVAGVPASYMTTY